jgi:hypothetical protein
MWSAQRQWGRPALALVAAHCTCELLWLYLMLDQGWAVFVSMLVSSSLAGDGHCPEPDVCGASASALVGANVAQPLVTLAGGLCLLWLRLRGHPPASDVRDISPPAPPTTSTSCWPELPRLCYWLGCVVGLAVLVVQLGVLVGGLSGGLEDSASAQSAAGAGGASPFPSPSPSTPSGGRRVLSAEAAALGALRGEAERRRSQASEEGGQLRVPYQRGSRGQLMCSGNGLVVADVTCSLGTVLKLDAGTIGARDQASCCEVRRVTGMCAGNSDKSSEPDIVCPSPRTPVSDWRNVRGRTADRCCECTSGACSDDRPAPPRPAAPCRRGVSGMVAGR